MSHSLIARSSATLQIRHCLRNGLRNWLASANSNCSIEVAEMVSRQPISTSFAILLSTLSLLPSLIMARYLVAIVTRNGILQTDLMWILRALSSFHWLRRSTILWRLARRCMLSAVIRAICLPLVVDQTCILLIIVILAMQVTQMLGTVMISANLKIRPKTS